ncbi:MAG: hypothetical protein WAX04_12860, partial [Oscillospiraceae bacterium]
MAGIKIEDDMDTNNAFQLVENRRYHPRNVLGFSKVTPYNSTTPRKQLDICSASKQRKILLSPRNPSDNAEPSLGSIVTITAAPSNQFPYRTASNLLVPTSYIPKASPNTAPYISKPSNQFPSTNPFVEHNNSITTA